MDSAVAIDSTVAIYNPDAFSLSKLSYDDSIASSAYAYNLFAACNKTNVERNNQEVSKARVSIKIDRVIFNNPATIVFWSDGSKTVVKCQEGDTFSKELGLAMCICKQVYGNKGNYNDVFKRFAYVDET